MTADGWQRLEISNAECIVSANFRTGEVEIHYDASRTWATDCETLKGIYLEMERKGMYD